MKRVCGIIAYHPSDGDVLNICAYSQIFDEVIVYLNSPVTAGQRMAIEHDGITIIGKGENDGLSIACDEICNYVKKHGDESVMLFDQDSRISKECVNTLYAHAEELFTHERVGIVCPSIDYGTKKLLQNGENTHVDWCITSGSLLNLSIYGDKVSFDKNYFIDRLDRDYCKQVQDVGYNIVRIGNAVLKQKLGETVSSWRRKCSSHSALRHYYIARNRLYYNRKFHVSGVKSFMQTTRQVYEVVCFEPEKVNKLKAIWVGIKDFWQGNFGKKR